ncbi:hypothetical protein [Echinicola pacifica]|nr:hypothetical protein [Echinicola pacifica]
MAFIFFWCYSLAYAQDFEQPSEKKSLVYFYQSNGTGALAKFSYYDGKSYLGRFGGKKCLILECEPGEHVFWVAAENRSFIEANLLPGKTYIIQVISTVGIFSSAVKLFPIEPSKEKFLRGMKRYMTKNPPIYLNRSDLSLEEAKLDYFIENGIDKYTRDKENEKPFRQLLPEYYFN